MTSVNSNKVRTPDLDATAASKEVTQAAAAALQQLQNAVEALTSLAANPALVGALPPALQAKLAAIGPALANTVCDTAPAAVAPTGTPFTGSLGMTKSRWLSPPSASMDKIAAGLEAQMARLGLEGRVVRDDRGIADTGLLNFNGYSSVSISLKDQPRAAVNELLAFARAQGWNALR